VDIRTDIDGTDIGDWWGIPECHPQPWLRSIENISNKSNRAGDWWAIPGAQFTADIRGCKDNSIRTSVILRIFKERKNQKTSKVM